MGSYTCPTCENTVHTAAKACPRCGRPRDATGRISFLQLLGFGVVVAVAYAVAPEFWGGMIGRLFGG